MYGFCIAYFVFICCNGFSITDMSEMDRDFFNRAINTQSYKYPFMQEGDKICINLVSAVYSETENFKRIPSYLISVQMSQAVLQDTLRNFMHNDHGSIALIGGVGGINLDLDIDPHLVNGIKAYLEKDIINNRKIAGEIFTLDYDDQNFVLYQKSQILDTTFIVVFQKSQLFSQTARYFGWLIIAYFSKFFKKHMGISPQEYKDGLKNRNL